MNLSAVIKEFSDFKVALGTGFAQGPFQLKSFLGTVGDVRLDDISEEQVQKFLLGTGPLTRYYRCKYTTINGLYKFAMARGYCTCLPLPNTLPKIQSKFTPYIYTREDLEKLLEATSQTNGTNTAIEPDTLRVIIVLLYGATLRISEALCLNVSDVDLDQGILTIRDSKFYKTRIVPIGPTLQAALSKYARSRHKKTSPGRFFLTKRKKDISKSLIQTNFIRLRTAAGVSRDDDYNPRLHDLRHTGAVHRIIDWYKKGKDVQKLLPLLSTYMGHVRLGDTQVYLTVIPEIMDHASSKFEKYAFDGVTL